MKYRKTRIESMLNNKLNKVTDTIIEAYRGMNLDVILFCTIIATICFATLLSNVKINHDLYNFIRRYENFNRTKSDRYEMLNYYHNLNAQMNDNSEKIEDVIDRMDIMNKYFMKIKTMKDNLHRITELLNRNKIN